MTNDFPLVRTALGFVILASFAIRHSDFVISPADLSCVDLQENR